LAGVAVTIKGSDKGTATDANGSFSITIPGNDAILVFTHVGYQTVEVATGGRSTINVSLDVSVLELSDVMITVPYGRQTRASYTGAATTVQSETVSERPRVSFVESLQ